MADWSGRAAIAALCLFAFWLVFPENDPGQGDQGLPIGGTEMSGEMREDRRDGFALFEAGEYTAAIEALRPLAEGDDAGAQCKLGIALTRASGAMDRARQVEAVKWLDQCVRRYDYPDEADNETARQLGDQLIETAGWDIVGEGRFLSFRFQQEKLNAELGMPNAAPESILADLASLEGGAAFRLGADLNNGNGMPVDFEKAVRAFHRAAEFDIPEAAFNLGVSYYAGKGVKADPVQALYWLKIGADAMYARAAMMAGAMLARGHGAPRDIDAALHYLHLAAELGDAEAGLMAEAVAAGAMPY